MRRIGLAVVLAASLTIAPLAAEAQQARNIPRIGILTTGTGSANPRFLEAFRQGLRELGYVEGQNILLEPRYAEGRVERFDHLATELVRLKVDVIVASGPMIQAAVKATNTIPIVMSAAADPVAQGFVVSLARPGRNVTGLSTLSPETTGKLLQLLKEVVPKATRLGVLSPGSGTGQANREGTKVAARALGLQLIEVFEARTPEALPRAFDIASKARLDVLLVFPGFLGLQYRQRIVEFAAKHHVPAVYQLQDFVEAGGLMSYGANLAERYHRAATYVDKLLKGAKPADLPVEQPTKFDLVINLKTAKALGLTIPPSVLARADPSSSSACSTHAANSSKRLSASPGSPDRRTTAPSGRCAHGWTPGPASAGSQSAWRTRATISNLRGTTSAVGALQDARQLITPGGVHECRELCEATSRPGRACCKPRRGFCAVGRGGGSERRSPVAGRTVDRNLDREVGVEDERPLLHYDRKGRWEQSVWSVRGHSRSGKTEFQFVGTLAGNRLTYGRDNVADLTIDGNRMEGTAIGRTNWRLKLNKQK
jgi:putative tryptophan/tyrosine transport system substrate-binding protein